MLQYRDVRDTGARLFAVGACVTSGLALAACSPSSAPSSDTFINDVQALSAELFGAEVEDCAQTEFYGLEADSPGERGYFACWVVPEDEVEGGRMA